MLPATGMLLHSEIQNIMGGEAPITTAEYYNSTGGLAQGVAGVPSSGLFLFSSLRGKSKNLTHGTAVRETPQQTYTTASTSSYTIATAGYYLLECIGGGGGGVLNTVDGSQEAEAGAEPLRVACDGSISVIY